MSGISLPSDAADLSLHRVAFARLSEGRIVARGTAERLDYRRAGGRLDATAAGATFSPEPGTGLAALGELHCAAPVVEGEIASRRGSAWGGVDLHAARGDVARTERVAYEGDTVRSDTHVFAQGPGYRVEGNGLLAQTDGTRVELNRGVRGQLEMEARK